MPNATLCILLILLSAASSTARAAMGSVQLAWAANSESDLAGYVLYYGTSSGKYTQSINEANTVTATVQNLTVGQTYYFAVAAYETTGIESPPSNEVVYTVAGPASVAFVGSDTSTHGNWKGVYGADGFTLAGDATSYPSYATVTNTPSSYTWTAFTSDVRALQKAAASSTGRLAACWYTATAAGSSYTIDVNLTDGNSHQLGIYVLDWDGYGPRAETVQLTDATSGTVLDTETVSSFQSGAYLIWTVSGHIKINVINNVPGTNAVASGLFFDPAGTTKSNPAPVTTGSTGSSGGSGSSGAVAALATFVGSDAATHGSWKGVYGADGFSLAGDGTSYPSYATVTNPSSAYTWTASTSDGRALQKAASSTDRLAACWYTPTLASGATYTIDVNLTDGNSHQLGFYVLDWDGYGPRAETVQLTDAASGTVLDAETISSFQAGRYLIWTVRGHVKINVINNVPGTNAVASGLFFDPAGATQANPPATTTGSSGGSGSGSSGAVSALATFVGSDASTHGSWKGVYGADGFSLAGDATSYPSYVTVANISPEYTWAASTSNVRALQSAASSTNRLAACWYTPTLAAAATYTIDVNLTDGNSHQIDFYVLDWDGYGPRAETVQLTDATNGTVLDTETVASFQGGGYLIWTVRGHIKINVINNVPGTNAVASGLFFDPAGTTKAAQ